VCAGTWAYKGQLRLTKQSLSLLPIDSDAALYELPRQGYFIAFPCRHHRRSEASLSLAVSPYENGPSFPWLLLRPGGRIPVS
jgi:hypothetical protein